MYQVGENIQFGRYPYEEDGTEENILWRVISEEDGKYLLLTDKIIDARAFHGADCAPIPTSLDSKKRIFGSVLYWTECELRNWLNTVFLKCAFDKEEIAHIVPVQVSDQKSTDCFYDYRGKNLVVDRVFLLSSQDFKFNYYGLYPDSASFIPSKDFVKQPSHGSLAQLTPYAMKNFLAGNPCPRHVPRNRYHYWWLRSQGYGDEHIACVTDGGYIEDTSMAYVLGVRPAVWYAPDGNLEFKKVM